LTVGEHAVRTSVVDCDPVTVDVPQHHVCPRHHRLRQPHICMDVAADYDVAARPERALPTTEANGDRGRQRPIHPDNLFAMHYDHAAITAESPAVKRMPTMTKYTP
jgi:hypothetical protein